MNHHTDIHKKHTIQYQITGFGLLRMKTPQSTVKVTILGSHDGKQWQRIDSTASVTTA